MRHTFSVPQIWEYIDELNYKMIWTLCRQFLCWFPVSLKQFLLKKYAHTLSYTQSGEGREKEGKEEREYGWEWESTHKCRLPYTSSCLQWSRKIKTNPGLPQGWQMSIYLSLHHGLPGLESRSQELDPGMKLTHLFMGCGYFNLYLDYWVDVAPSIFLESESECL